MPNDPPHELKTRGYNMVTGAEDVFRTVPKRIEEVKRFKKASVKIGEETERMARPWRVPPAARQDSREMVREQKPPRRQIGVFRRVRGGL
jgi:hypothetical protein